MLLSNDDYLFSEIRNKNISVIPQALQNKLYEMQSSNSVVETLISSGNVE